MNAKTIQPKAQWESSDRLWCVIDRSTRKIQCSTPGRPDIFTTRAKALEYNCNPKLHAVVRLHDISGTVL